VASTVAHGPSLFCPKALPVAAVAFTPHDCGAGMGLMQSEALQCRSPCMCFKNCPGLGSAVLSRMELTVSGMFLSFSCHSVSSSVRLCQYGGFTGGCSAWQVVLVWG
jgi:hypothetical protein